MFSFWQLVVVLVIVLILFGPSRLEKLGPSLGKTIKGFRDGIKSEKKDDEEPKEKLVNSDKDSSDDSEKKT